MSLPFGKIINQLDLALDHLAQRDEDSARFALMLIDNVVEMTLHRHALAAVMRIFIENDDHKIDETIVHKAQGTFFGPKVKLARKVGLVSPETAKSISHLHKLRNVAYHQGIFYAETIRSLTIFYFKIACELLQKKCLIPLELRKQVPYRATKYLDHPASNESTVWAQLEKVANALPSDLLSDLVHGMTQTIQSIDDMIGFWTTRSNPQISRNQVLTHAQMEALIFSPDGKKAIAEVRAKQRDDFPTEETVNLLLPKIKGFVHADPIPEWRKQLQLLEAEKNQHTAVGIYCGFMERTADIREKIDVFDSSHKLNLQ